jgi:hypothetical protein
LEGEKMEIKGEEIEEFLKINGTGEEIEKLPKTLQKKMKDGQEKLKSGIESVLGSPLLRICSAFCREDYYEAADEILKYPGEISLSGPLKTIVEKVVEVFLRGELYHGGTIVRINKLLAKIGYRLTQSPWKEKFIDMTKNHLDLTIPSGAMMKDVLNGIIQEAKNAGFEEKEIIEALRIGVENAEEREGIHLRTFEARVALNMPIGKEYLQELMRQGDSSIQEGYNFTIEHGISVFRAIQGKTDIGRKRKRLVSKFDQLMRKYEGRMIDSMVDEFRKFAGKLGITVSYPSGYCDD